MHKARLCEKQGFIVIHPLTIIAFSETVFLCIVTWTDVVQSCMKTLTRSHLKVSSVVALVSNHSRIHKNGVLIRSNNLEEVIYAINERIHE